MNQTKVFDCIEDRPTTQYIKNKLSTICGKKCNKNHTQIINIVDPEGKVKIFETGNTCNSMTPYYNEEEYITISTLLKSEIENRNNELQDVNHDNKERKMKNVN